MWCGGSAAVLFPGAANNHCIIADHFPPDKTETLGESAGFGEILAPFWGRLAHCREYRFYAGYLPAKITQILISRWWSWCLRTPSLGSFQWSFPGALQGPSRRIPWTCFPLIAWTGSHPRRSPCSVLCGGLYSTMAPSIHTFSGGGRDTGEQCIGWGRQASYTAPSSSFSLQLYDGTGNRREPLEEKKTQGIGESHPVSRAQPYRRQSYRTQPIQSQAIQPYRTAPESAVPAGEGRGEVR